MLTQISPMLDQVRSLTQVSTLPRKLPAGSRVVAFPGARGAFLFARYDATGELRHAEIRLPYAVRDSEGESNFLLMQDGQYDDRYGTWLRNLRRHRALPKHLPLSAPLEMLFLLVSVNDYAEISSPQSLANAITHGLALPLLLHWTGLPKPSALLAKHFLQPDMLDGHKAPIDTHVMPASNTLTLTEWLRRHPSGDDLEGFCMVHTPAGPQLYAYRIMEDAQSLAVVQEISYTLGRDRRLTPIIHVSSRGKRQLTKINLNSFRTLRHHHVAVGSVVGLSFTGGVPNFRETVAEEGYCPLPTCPYCHTGSTLLGQHAYCVNETCVGSRIKNLMYAMEELNVASLSESKVENLVLAKHDFLTLAGCTVAQMMHVPGIGRTSASAIYRAYRHRVPEMPLDKLARISGCFHEPGLTRIPPNAMRQMADFLHPSMSNLSTGDLYRKIMTTSGIGRKYALTFMAGIVRFRVWYRQLGQDLLALPAAPNKEAKGLSW